MPICKSQERTKIIRVNNSQSKFNLQHFNFAVSKCLKNKRNGCYLYQLPLTSMHFIY